MTLNHTNLTVTNVEAACGFLQKYFGLQRTGGNAGMGFMSDGNGFILSLMKAKRDVDVIYPGYFHIGFFVSDRTIVDAVNQQLKNDGFDVNPPTEEHAYTFYVNAPGGFMVELGAL